MTDFDAQSGRAMPTEPELTVQETDSDDNDVTAAVRGLAGLVADVEDLDEVLGRIAGFAVSCIPGSDGAGATLIQQAKSGPPKVVAWAVTEPLVREIDHLQYDICGEGPCLTSMASGRPILSGSLGSDTRWPRFGGRVARLGVHSALSLPLIVQGEVVGCLNIYARERDVFTQHAFRLGAEFAVPAAVSVHTVQKLRAAHLQAEQLRLALDSRAVIDQAIGIIRSRAGGTGPEAFQRLRQISQAENVRLAVVAERLVEEAVRRAQSRHGQP